MGWTPGSTLKQKAWDKEEVVISETRAQRNQMRLASTPDRRIDIGKMKQKSQIQARKAKKRQPKGSSCVPKVTVANTTAPVMLDHLISCIEK